MAKNSQNISAEASEEAVLAATGKGWEDWFAILDTDEATSMTHKDIALHLFQKFPHVSGWWCQSITVGYERARGMREKHQMTDGYKISRSRTLDVPPKVAYAAWVEEGRRALWLAHPIEIRKQTPDKSLRVTWLEDQTHLTVNLYEKGEGKTQVVVEHTKLSDAEDAEVRKAFWTESLESLANTLEGV